LRNPSLVTSRLGIVGLLKSEREGVVGNAEVMPKPYERPEDSILELHVAVGLLSPAPLWLTWGEKPIDIRGAPPRAHCRCGFCCVGAELGRLAKMSDVNSDEEMRAVVGQRRIALQRTHLGSDGAGIKKASPNPFGPPNGCNIPQIASPGSVVDVPSSLTAHVAGMLRQPYVLGGSCPSLPRLLPCQER